MPFPKQSTVEELRELVEQRRPARNRDGYPEEVKLRVVGWACRGRNEGHSFHALAAMVGLSRRTLRAWCSEGAEPKVETDAAVNAGTFLPVGVDLPPPCLSRTLRWSTPSGHVVEGLSLDDVVRLLTVVA